MHTIYMNYVQDYGSSEELFLKEKNIGKKSSNTYGLRWKMIFILYRNSIVFFYEI